MTDPDQTVVLPRQREPDPVDEAPRPDPWQAPVSASAAVGGLNSAEAALTRLAWVLATVLTAGVGMIRAGWPALSPDGLATWALAETSWPELWRLREQLPATDLPYYALLRGWAELFGSTEFSLRVPSVLAMAAAAGGTAALLARLVSPRAGVLAGLLFVAVPATFRWAHEPTPHALGVALAVLATGALVWVFQRPGAWRVIGYGAAVAVLGAAHAPALLILLGHGFAVLALRRRVTAAWAVAAVVGAAPGVGLLFVGRAPWQPPPVPEPVGAPSVTTAAASLFGLAVIGGAVLGLGVLAASAKKPGGVFTGVAAAPLLAVYPALAFTDLDPATLLLSTVPSWLSLAAFSLHRMPLVRGLLVVGVVAAIGVPSQLAIREADGHGLAGRQVAEVLHEHARPRDAIIFGPDRYDRRVGRDLVARYVLAPARPADVLADTAPRTGGRLLAHECVQVQRCVDDAPRIWLLRTGSSPDPLAGMPAAKDEVLRVHYDLARTWSFAGVELALFTLAPDGPAR